MNKKSLFFDKYFDLRKTVKQLAKTSLQFYLLFNLVSIQAQAVGSMGTQTGNVEGTSITFFRNKVSVSATRVLTPNNATTSFINSEITRISNLGGGVLRFTAPNGNNTTYTLGEIILKSNIRIEVEDNVIFKIDKSGNNHTLFNLGRNTRTNQAKIENIEIIGAGDKQNQWFTIDVRNFGILEKAAPFKIGYVKNFALSRFFVKDNFTNIPSVFMVADSKYISASEGYDLNTFGRIPEFGVVKSAKATNIATGYALVQLFSGRNIMLEKLFGKKGITVRLEPGSGKGNDDLNKVTNRKTGNIANIRLVNISNNDGFTSLFLKPHAKLCENVTAINIRAKNSLSALYVAAASLTPQSRRGNFKNTSIKNISFKQDKRNQEGVYLADTGLEGLSYALPSYRNLLQTKRNNTSPKPPILTLVEKDASQQRWTTYPIAAVIMTSALSKNNTGNLNQGRFRVSIPNEADIKTSGFFDGKKVVYRNEAINLVDSTPNTDLINK